MIDSLEDLIETKFVIPFTGKCLIDKEEMLELIKELRLKLPDDVKQAKWVKDERQRILHEAQRDANSIVKEAQKKINELIDEHEITRKAYEQSNEIIANAQKNARDIRLGAREYADSILGRVEEILEENLETIRTNRNELK